MNNRDVDGKHRKMRKRCVRSKEQSEAWFSKRLGRVGGEGCGLTHKKVTESLFQLKAGRAFHEEWE